MHTSSSAWRRQADYLIGYFLFLFLFVLSFIQITDAIQGALLFNVKFAESLRRSRLLNVAYVANTIDRTVERKLREQKEKVRGAV